MLKFRLVLSCLAFIFLLTPCVLSAREEHDKYVCGVIVPLTGPGAEWGMLIRNSMEMAREDLKDSSVIFLYEDDQYTAKNTVSAAQKFLSQKTDCLVTLGSSPSMSVQDLAERTETPLFAIALNPNVGKGKKSVFRYYVPISRQREAISREIIRRNYKRIAFVTSTNDTTIGLRDALLESKTITPVLSEEVSVGEVDLASVAVKILSAHPDAVFLNMVPPQSSTLARRLRNSGYRGEFFGGPLLESKEEALLAKGSLNEAWFVTVDNANAKDFNVRYENQFTTRPGILSVYAYDIATIIIKGHKALDLRAYVQSLRSFDGLAGHYGWDGTVFDIPAAVWIIRGDTFARAPRY